jgi:F-type H+-transporting ATPase subunit a
MTATPATTSSPAPGGRRGLSRRTKVLIGVGLYLLIGIALGVIFGSTGRNDAYKPQNEFKLDPWISIHFGSLDMSINKAVLYLFLACGLTIATMMYIANRMQQRPNRVQTAVEAAYHLMKDNIVAGNMDRRMAARWFTFVGTLFLFIWFSNMLGYFPLPTNTEHKVDVFGLQLPTFALYAATANLSVPLTMTLVVWFSYHFEGIRAKGFVGYLKSWVPAGVTGFAAGPIFVIEVISHFVRIISLSVRLFANILAGHLLILFMGGGLVVLLGLAAIGVFTLPLAIAFYLFEVVLIATLQAFIFATLTAIYLGGATAEAH